jgi:cation diffusion facilitator family transporter
MSQGPRRQSVKHPISTGRIVAVSFVVDLLDVVTNLTVAVLTGSAVVFAEMVQGVADSIGSSLLVVGHRRSRRAGDSRHPLGYGREVFFWALMSSLVMLFLGSTLSLWRGWGQLDRVEPLGHPWLALAVMVLSVVTNGYALSQSVRKLRTPGQPLGSVFTRSSRQLVKTALLRDLLGTTSAILGLAALMLYATARVVLFDALGAILIGLLMAFFGFLLLSEARSYIAGRSVPAETLQRIRVATFSVPEVEAVNDCVALVVGSEQMAVDLDLDLIDDLTTHEVERVLDDVEQAIQGAVPEVLRVRVDLSSRHPIDGRTPTG